tara:strand:- start:1927 stop:2421 length:495 start_codon:yes stop_codon:yes gene_type:complete
MGFDLYGMSPKIHKPMPPMLQEVEDAPEGTSVWDMWDKSERRMYSLQVHTYEEDNPGVYFYNTIHFWRPLWEYVYGVCGDILDEDDFINGHTNDSYVITESKAKKIAGTLYKLLATGTIEDDIQHVVDKLDDEGTLEAEELPFNKENVKQFALFCKESGGFKIC